MAAEVFAGITAIKTAFDIAKNLKDMDSAVSRNAAVIELQEQIFTALSTQTTLLERIDTLKKEVANFKTWDTEKKKNELKNLGASSFAYMLKPKARGAEPPHWVCQKCYRDQQIYVIQSSQKDRRFTFYCPNCKNTVNPYSFAFAKQAQIPGTLGELVTPAYTLRWLDD